MKENSILLDNLLDRTFFSHWKEKSSSYHLEFIVNGKCDNKCSYCYIHNYRDKVFPADYDNDSVILNNMDMTLRWLKKNNWKPVIEIFSGEFLSQPIAYEVLDLLLSNCWEGMTVIVPTNMNFILNDEYVEKVKYFKSAFKQKGAKIHNSASFDGPYMDEDNRPSIYGKRDDAFYDKAFQTLKEIGDYGFHPMVYSNNIELWKENFLWFQSMFKEYKMPWNNLYLLEVRNKEWTAKQIRDYGEFVKFVVRWGHDILRPNQFIEFLTKEGFNFISNVFAHTGKGLACALPTNLHLRVGDLKVFPCHRLMYPDFELFNMRVENNEITGIDEKNFQLFFATKFSNFRNFPYCSTCAIKNLCVGQCLGAQFETTGDMFTPIPTVCALFHCKIKSLIEAYEEVGVLDKLRPLITNQKWETIQRMKGERHEN